MTFPDLGKTAKIREKEQEKAAKILGVSGVTFLRVPMENWRFPCPAERSDRLIRAYQPARILLMTRGKLTSFTPTIEPLVI